MKLVKCLSDSSTAKWIELITGWMKGASQLWANVSTRIGQPLCQVEINKAWTHVDLSGHNAITTLSSMAAATAGWYVNGRPECIRIIKTPATVKVNLDEAGRSVAIPLGVSMRHKPSNEGHWTTLPASVTEVLQMSCGLTQVVTWYT